MTVAAMRFSFYARVARRARRPAPPRPLTPPHRAPVLGDQNQLESGLYRFLPPLQAWSNSHTQKLLMPKLPKSLVQFSFVPGTVVQ